MRNILGMQRDVMMGLAPSEARDGRIKIHGPEAFEGMRRAGMLAAETLDFITPHVRPGITTGELDRLCHGFIVDHDAIPAPLNYRGFPKSICPSILHYGRPGDGPALREGMFFTIEPMINAGRYEVKILSDGWTAVTKDRSLSAQFEHTVGVTATGYEIFTISPAGLHRPPYPAG